jgi:hypothetical protein
VALLNDCKFEDRGLAMQLLPDSIPWKDVVSEDFPSHIQVSGTMSY